jgi:PAS domain S-box-containing protein
MIDWDNIEQLAAAIRAAEVGLWRLDLATGLDRRDSNLNRILGLPAKPTTVTLDDVFSRIHPEDRARVQAAWERALAEGGSYQVENRIVRSDGSVRWIRDRGQVMADAQGRPLYVTGAIVDITDRKHVEEELRERNRALELLNQVSTTISRELELERLVQHVTDVGTELTGAAFGAFFYNVLNERGEAYQLYALSGAPREAFGRFPMPRNTAVFGATFRGEGVVRSDDITQDPRYGQNPPYRGMPKDHLPVRSYLAAPVVSHGGEVLGGLFFGHPDPGVFTPLAERLVAGVAAHAAVAIDNARLYQTAQNEIAERRRIEEQQRLLVAELSHRVKNILAVVQAVAAQTGPVTSVVEYRAAFQGRLGALVAAHVLLTERSWRSASLGELVRAVLEPHQGTRRVQLELDEVPLTPTAAQTLALAFHELATNASKYGALSTAGGRVKVTGHVTNGAGVNELRVQWQETRGPKVVPPTRRGFGTTLLSHALEYQHGGAVELDWRAAGLICRISVPLAEIAASPPA